ncbi:hypothetical protein D3C83_327810 [compost metagenome]
MQRSAVIAVLVGQQNSVDFQRVHPALRESQSDLPGAQSAIHQQARLRSLDECAVARAPTAENRDGKH